VRRGRALEVVALERDEALGVQCGQVGDEVGRVGELVDAVALLVAPLADVERVGAADRLVGVVGQRALERRVQGAPVGEIAIPSKPLDATRLLVPGVRPG
jgi:hypothetical protein